MDIRRFVGLTEKEPTEALLKLSMYIIDILMSNILKIIKKKYLFKILQFYTILNRSE